MTSAWLGILAAAAEGVEVAGGRDWLTISAAFAAAFASFIVLLLECISRSRIGKEKDAQLARMDQELKSLKSEQEKQIAVLEEKAKLYREMASPDVLESAKAQIKALEAILKQAQDGLEKERQGLAAAEASGTETAEQLAKERELRERREKKLEEKERHIHRLETELERYRLAADKPEVKELSEAAISASGAAVASASVGGIELGPFMGFRMVPLEEQLEKVRASGRPDLNELGPFMGFRMVPLEEQLEKLRASGRPDLNPGKFDHFKKPEP